MNEYAEMMSQSFQDELQKIASRKVANAASRPWLLPAAAGGILTMMATKANEDRKLGKRIRAQQGG